MRWPNVGPARVPTLGQRWQSALAQCNVARRGNVGPTVVNQRQPSANQPTINQRWANASMLSGAYCACLTNQIDNIGRPWKPCIFFKYCAI